MSLAIEFAKIFEQYDEINTSYVDKENHAVENDDDTDYAKWVDKRKLNDAIHFLFMFSRFEDFVREKSIELIRSKIIAGSYRDRSGWIVLKDYDREDKLHLMKRVQLFMDKGDVRFAKIKDYYDTRNQLAHGGTYNTPIQIEIAKNDLLNFSTLFSIP